MLENEKQLNLINKSYTQIQKLFFLFSFSAFLIQDKFIFVDKLEKHVEELVFKKEEDLKGDDDEESPKKQKWNVFDGDTFFQKWIVHREISRINERAAWANKMHSNVQNAIDCSIINLYFNLLTISFAREKTCFGK